MRAGIRKGLIARDMFPVFCVSAEKDMCVRRFMEFVINVAPSAGTMPPSITEDGQDEVPYDEKGPTSLYMFNTTVEPHLGEVIYFQSGIRHGIHEGDDLYNATNDAVKNVSPRYTRWPGKNRTKVIGNDGRRHRRHRETEKHEQRRHAERERRSLQVRSRSNTRIPVSEQPSRAANTSDEEKLAEVLQRIHQEDPTFLVEYSKELKQMIISGQGEFHLNTMKWRIEHNDKLEIEFYPPRIPYRETITKYAYADYRHRKQSGGAGQFGEVHLVIEPYARRACPPRPCTRSTASIAKFQ